MFRKKLFQDFYFVCRWTSLFLLTIPTFFTCEPIDNATGNDIIDVSAYYNKVEYQIPMRDGIKLYTAVYVPKDTSQNYPFLMRRTPYSSGPYGEDNFPRILGPTGNSRFAEEGYIFVYQDVRGRFMSEGTFAHMTPHIAEKTSPTDVDESSDTYDTVDWLIKNVHPNNGRVGMWGISYPGFYAAAGIIDTHPAIKASSLQAPIGDWFVGDDFHHNGALFLLDVFNFCAFFESPAPNPTDQWGERFQYGSEDSYQFFLDLGPLPNANETYLNHKMAFWDSLMRHGQYDTFWQRRNIIPHLQNVNTNVLIVMGFFDAEDPYGPLEIYQSIEQNNPGINNSIVMGPWFHGGWVRSEGDSLGNISFGEKTSHYYQENIDLAFFNFYLKDKGSISLPEVLAFSSGSNEWHDFEQWPPQSLSPTSFYFREGGLLSFSKPSDSDQQQDAYISDPRHPVPYTSEIRIDRSREYMVEDQRFAGYRSDVLVYETDSLDEDFTFAGPIEVNLFVSTTGTDADFIVKLIDVFPQDFPDREGKYLDVPMGGYQMLVRAEVMRAKFRNSLENPEPLTPGEVTQITFDMPDLFHTFKTGHRIMVQVQSSWFPLIDRNPQKFVDIYNAKEEDFQTATHTLYHSSVYPSHLRIGRLIR